MCTHLTCACMHACIIITFKYVSVAVSIAKYCIDLSVGTQLAALSRISTARLQSSCWSAGLRRDGRILAVK